MLQYYTISIFNQLHSFMMILDLIFKVKFPFFLQNVSLNGNSPVLRIAKAGDNLTVHEFYQNRGITGFIPEHDTYKPLEWGFTASNEKFIVALSVRMN